MLIHSAKNLQQKNFSFKIRLLSWKPILLNLYGIDGRIKSTNESEVSLTETKPPTPKKNNT